MKILTIVGARPQFIKAAAFSNEFRKDKANIEILVHTGQHYDEKMSDIFFEELNIPKPNYNLAVGSGSHGLQTGEMLKQIEKVIIKEKPDAVLVYGDTNSTLAGALAASKLLTPVFHIEAGLRSYDKNMPEEQNRILTDHLSKLLFCPTEIAIENLNKEGIISGVYNVGDIMYETVLNNIKIAESKYKNQNWKSEITSFNSRLNELNFKNYYLATIHRPHNTDNLNNLKNILTALNDLNKPVLLPLHPRTENKLSQLNLKLDNIIFVEPLSYLLMLFFIKNAYMTITDSGGLQKETYFLKTPGTILRDTTEWTETLENDWNVLSGITYEEIIINANRKLDCLTKEQSKKFGDGKTSKEIIHIIKMFFEKEENK